MRSWECPPLQQAGGIPSEDLSLKNRLLPSTNRRDHLSLAMNNNSLQSLGSIGDSQYTSVDTHLSSWQTRLGYAGCSGGV